MKKKNPITELLGITHDASQAARKKEDAQTDLYAYFIDQARTQAAKRMSPALKGRRNPTSLAHEALTSCLENAKKTKAPIASRDEFEKYLNRHLAQKIANAAEHEKAQKRDLSKEVQTETAPDTESRQLTPADQAAARELAIKTVHCLYEEPYEPRRAIVTLGLLLDFSATEIQEAIEPLLIESDDKDFPTGYSLSSIRQILNNRKKILEERFK